MAETSHECSPPAAKPIHGQRWTCEVCGALWELQHPEVGFDFEADEEVPVSGKWVRVEE